MCNSLMSIANDVLEAEYPASSTAETHNIGVFKKETVC
jgi:hypothetical protein